LILNPHSLPAIASLLAQARRAGAIRNPQSEIRNPKLAF
jgi:hypothetical protein